MTGDTGRSKIPVPTSFLKGKRDLRDLRSPTAASSRVFGRSSIGPITPNKRVKISAKEGDNGIIATSPLRRPNAERVVRNSNLKNTRVALSPNVARAPDGTKTNPSELPRSPIIPPAAIPNPPEIPSQAAFAAVRKKCPAWDLKV